MALVIGSYLCLDAEPTSPLHVLGFVEGVDSTDKPMIADEIAQLNDPWVVLVLG